MGATGVYGAGTAGYEEYFRSDNNKCSVVLMPATVHMANDIIEEENIVVEEMDGSGVELSSAPKGLYKVLWQSSKAVCLVYGALFTELLEAVHQYSVHILKGAHPVMCKPP